MSKQSPDALDSAGLGSGEPMRWAESVRVGGFVGRRFRKQPVRVAIDAMRREVRGRRRQRAARNRIDDWRLGLGTDRLTLEDLRAVLEHAAFVGDDDGAAPTFVDLELEPDDTIRQVGIAIMVSDTVHTAESDGVDAEALSALLANRLVVAHNGAAHDFPLLRDADVDLPPQRVDSLQWSWLAWPTEPSHSLGALADRHLPGGPDGALHDAVVDARTLARLWPSITAALSAIDARERAALRYSLDGVESSVTLDELLGSESAPWVVEPEWIPDSGAPPVRSAVIDEHTYATTGTPDGAAIVVESLRHAAIGSECGLVACPSSVLDPVKVARAEAGWDRATALRTLSQARGALELAPAAAAHLLHRLCREGSELLQAPGWPLFTDLATATIAPPDRPLVLDVSLAALFEPVSSRLIVPSRSFDGEASVEIGALGQEDRSATIGLLVEHAPDALIDRARAGEGSLLDTGDDQGLWLIDALDPGAHASGVVLVLRGPVGGRRSAPLWHQLLGPDVSITGRDRSTERWVALEGASHGGSRRHPGRRTAVLLGIATAWEAKGSSTVVVDGPIHRRAITRAAAKLWFERRHRHLLRPPEWPTIEEACRRLIDGGSALVGPRGGRQLAEVADRVLLSRAPLPARSQPTFRRIAPPDLDDPFGDVIEPLAAHLTAEMISAAAGETLVADPLLGTGLLAELVGQPRSVQLAEVDADNDMTSALLDRLLAGGQRGVAHGDAVQLAVRKLLEPGQELRSFQTEVVADVLEGRDVFAVFRTGLGKSLCYQVPALALAASDAVTLVISPLVALQRDQIDGLRRRGVLEATAFNASMPPELRRTVLRGLRAGFYRVLFLAPEALSGHAIRRALEEVEIGLIAVDEAHCISEMGHDFRPDYRTLPRTMTRLLGLPDGRALSSLPDHPTIVALTGTASPAVIDDVERMLDADFSTHLDETFVRRELCFSVHPLDGEERRFGDAPLAERRRVRWQALLEILETTARPSIIYAQTRAETVDLADALRRELGVPVVVYHGGLDDSTRRDAERRFLSGDTDLIVATSAFGMGIDKDDVRSVVHWEVPMTPEALYQEAGRAGRGLDGDQADAVLLFHEDDLDAAYRIQRRGLPSRWDVERTDIALRELVDHQGRSVVTVADADLSRLASLRGEVEPRIVLAHLERAGLIREIDRVHDARSVRRTGREVEALTQLERLLLDLAPLDGICVSVTGSDLTGLGETSEPREIWQGLDGLERRGLLERCRSIDLRLLEEDASTIFDGARTMANQLWRELRTHRDRYGRRFHRSLNRNWGDRNQLRLGIELLAAFGLADVRHDADDTTPAVRLADHADPEALSAAFANASALLHAVRQIDASRMEVAELVTTSGLDEDAVLDGATLLHLVGAATVDLRSFEDRGAGVARIIEVCDVSDRDTLIADALRAATERARAAMLRLEVLRRYSEIESSDDDIDAHQAYLERYLTERDFLDLVAADSTGGLLAPLTPTQREIVQAPGGGQLVVLAGPGTGKTRTVVSRIAYRVRSGYVLPERVLAITFARAATEETAVRLAQLGVRGVEVRTLDSLALRIVRENWAALGLPEEPKIVDKPERRRIMAAVAPDRNAQKLLEELDLVRGRRLEVVDPIHLQYLKKLQERSLIDFAAAKVLAVEFLDDPDRARPYVESFDEVYVDEFQDLSPLQIDLADAISDPANQTLVGDPRQAVFEWQGASPEELIERHERADRSFDLVESFRSTTPILTLGNRIIAHHLPHLPPLQSAADTDTRPVERRAARDRADMIDVVIRQVRQWLRDGVDDTEIAVLAKTNKVVDEIERALRSAGVAAQSVGLPPLPTTRAFQVFARAAESEGTTDLDEESPVAHLDRLRSTDAVAEALAGHTDEETSENDDDWARLRSDIIQLERDGLDSLADAPPKIRSGFNAPRRRGITVATMTSSKGLEWDAVAVTDVGKQEMADWSGEPEECRKLYVAVTRARLHLHLSWTGAPTRWLA